MIYTLMEVTACTPKGAIAYLHIVGCMVSHDGQERRYYVVYRPVVVMFLQGSRGFAVQLQSVLDADIARKYPMVRNDGLVGLSHPWCDVITW